MAASKAVAASARRGVARYADRHDVSALEELSPTHPASKILDFATACVFAVDENWQFTYLNKPAYDEIAEGRALLRKSLWAEFPALLGTKVERQYREAMTTRREARLEAYYGPLGGWYEIAVAPLAEGGLAVWFRSIDGRKKAEEELRRAEERYRLAASAATDLVLDWNLETGQVVLWESLQSDFGFGDGVVRSRRWCAARVHPDDRADVFAEIRRCLKTGERFVCEMRLCKADGAYADVRQTGVVQCDTRGHPLRMIVAMRDVSEQNRANNAIRRRTAQLANIFSQALVGILESGPDGRARLVNARFCEILGRTEDEVLGVDVMAFTHPDDLPWNNAFLGKQRKDGEAFQIEKRYIRPDGTTVWCRVSVSFVCAPTGEVESSIVVAEDITQQRETNERLKWASEHDALTGLPNRRAFDARLQAATLRAMHTRRAVGLLLLDLDHFKHVNDSAGHAAGDQLLQEIGDRLGKCLRHTDLAARLGGDEFAILVEHCSGSADLAALGNEIRKHLRRPFRIDGRTINVDVSIGGAVFPADAESANELFKHADVALYALKDSGRGGTRMFRREMLEQALVVATQLDLARSAVSDRTVDPHYQPKVDLCTGRIVGFEALLRWHHEGRGLQPPDSVLEAFRDYELASKIGDLVQRRVFSDLREWLRQGLRVGRVAVNAAPAEFLRDDFAERLLARLHEHDIPPALIEVEVTEHVFLDRCSGFVGRALEVLSRAGVHIALDDFGTGYSSLSHLRDFPVDLVKIDRSFVEKVATDPDMRAIVAAIAALARSLRLSVVAEGIETEQQRRILLEQGCSLGQGYYFGRAIAADRVPALLDARRTAGFPSM